MCTKNKLLTGWFSLTPHMLTAASRFFRSRGLAGPSRADSGTRVSSQEDGCTVSTGKWTSRLVRPHAANEVLHAKTLTWRNPKGSFFCGFKEFFCFLSMAAQFRVKPGLMEWSTNQLLEGGGALSSERLFSSEV